MSSLSGVRPTKGFLIELKRRISFIERGCEFLKLKRDQLAKELSASIEVLRGRRGTLEGQLRRIYDLVVSAYLSLGPTEVGSQASSIKKEFVIDVLPVSVMGVLYPRIRVRSKPRVEGRLDITLSRAAELALGIMEELVQVAEFEARDRMLSRQSLQRELRRALPVTQGVAQPDVGRQRVRLQQPH